MSSLPETLVEFRSSLEGAIVREQAAQVRGRRRRKLAAVGAMALVLVVGTASAFATGLLGDGKPHVQSGFVPSEGRRGSFTVRILFMEKSDAGGEHVRTWRAWSMIPQPGLPSPADVAATGQYVQVTGRGRIVRIGGKAQAWSARLEGFVTRPGEAKQRVVITMRGRPKGVFVLTPQQPGFLKRDSGTQTHTATIG